MSQQKPDQERILDGNCPCIRRRKTQKLVIRELFVDYAKSSTLHGLRYVGEQKLTTLEKLFWIATFTTSLILCVVLIKNVYVKWSTSPVIVSIDEKLASVRDVPFPSVTICPQVKIKARVYNLTEEMFTLTAINHKGIALDEAVLAKCADVMMLCDYFPSDLYSYSGRRRFTDATLIDHFDEVAPNASDVFTHCYWQHRYVPCRVLFKKVLTSEGLCFNMNGLSSDEILRGTTQSDYNYIQRKTPKIKGWSFENGYTEDSLDTFPYRGTENIAWPDLQMVLMTHVEDIDGLCNGLEFDHKIYLQHPTDAPQATMHHYAASDGEITSLAINFHVIKTSHALIGYSSEIRQCYFTNERYLRFFKLYTESNCRAECLSNYSYTECGCVGFYMPHNNSNEICAEGSYNCMHWARTVMTEKEQGLEGICRCLPHCDSVEYDADVIKTSFNFKSIDDSTDNSSLKFSKLNIFYKKARFYSMRRSELFGVTDFFANVGGLLGVFMGFSFLSLIEILYFLFIRLGLRMKRNSVEFEQSRLDSTQV